MLVAIEAFNLKYSYPNAKIIDDCSFRIEKGKIYCLLGRNGSGKTTLLNILNARLKPDFGKILVDGENMDKISRRMMGRIIGFVPQEHSGVFDYKTIDMVLMGRYSHLGILARPREQDYIIADTALKTVGIGHLRDRNYMEISGGERQMILLARVIAQEAAYFLLDEPTSHLDFTNQEKIMRTLRQIIVGQGCSAVMAMHDPNLAMAFADEIIMMKNGLILRQGEAGLIMTAENLSELYEMDMKMSCTEDGRRWVYIV